MSAFGVEPTPTTLADKNYQLLKQAYADAETAFANAEASAMTNAAMIGRASG